MNGTKYTFGEFVAAIESDDFDNPTDDNKIWANKFIMHVLDHRDIHDGDCTHQPYPCKLCIVQVMLEDYSLYFHDEYKFRKQFEE